MTFDHENFAKGETFISNKMAVTAVLFWVPLLLSVIGLNAEGELAVLHSPDSLRFTSTSPLQETLLKEVFSACLGLSVEQNSKWDGLLITDPFNTPEVVVEVYVDGVSSLGPAANLKVHTYPLIVDEYEPDTFEAVKHRITQRFAEGGNKLVSIDLSDSKDKSDDVFGDIIVPKLEKHAYQYLKPFELEEDHKFIVELGKLREITLKVKSGLISSDNAVDFMYIRFRSLHALSDFHGPSSKQTKEAKKLLGEALENVKNAFVKAYDGSVLVTVVSTDVAHTRRAVRSVNDAETRSSVERTKYPEDYAAIFNILLWFGVVFVFTLVAIVYALIDMDPGRDSIIYRMTSTRMKKDN